MLKVSYLVSLTAAAGGGSGVLIKTPTDYLMDYETFQSGYGNGWVTLSEKTNKYTPAVALDKSCTLLKTCHDCAFGQGCKWSGGRCTGRTTDQKEKGPTFEDFFTNAAVCTDTLKVCDVQEDPAGTFKLGFKPNAQKRKIPANYFCT